MRPSTNQDNAGAPRRTPLEGRASTPPGYAAPFSQPLKPVSGGPSDPPRLNLQIVRSVRMHKRLATGVAAAILLVMVALAALQPRLYTAQSLVYLEPVIARNLDEPLGGPSFDQYRYSSYIDQQMQTVTRLDTLINALHTLPIGTWRLPKESEQAAAVRLQKALVVEHVLSSFQISIKLTTGNANAGAAIVNAVTRAYLQSGRKDELAQADGREQLLSEERERIHEEMESDRREQAQLGASLGVANPISEQGNPFDAELMNLRTQLAAARQAHAVAAAQLSSVSGQDQDQRSGLEAAADESVISDAGLSSMKSAVNARRAILQSQMAGLTSGNPLYKQDQEELADLDRSVDRMTAQVRSRAEQRIEDKLRTDLERTAEVEARLNQQLAGETAKATGAGPKLQLAAELAADIQRLTAQYTTIDDAYKALDVQTSGPGMAHIAQEATAPPAPDANRGPLLLLAALPLALIGGVVAAVLARVRAGRIYLAQDLEQEIGFPPIAVIPACEDVPHRVLDEYVLRLAAGVESAYRNAEARTFLLTAVSVPTGTATLTGLLAEKLRQMRLRVQLQRSSDLLVTSQETMEHRAHLASQLADLARLAGEEESRLPAQGEGIASAKLERMKASHDIILIEAGPLLHSAETEYAARCADATILLVESGLTRASELRDAAQLLARLRVSGIAAVLVQLRLQNADESFKLGIALVQERRSDSIFERHEEQTGEVSNPQAASASPETPPAEPPILADESEDVVPAENTSQASSPESVQDIDDSSAQSECEPDGRLAEAPVGNAPEEEPTGVRLRQLALVPRTHECEYTSDSEDEEPLIVVQKPTVVEGTWCGIPTPAPVAVAEPPMKAEDYVRAAERLKSHKVMRAGAIKASEGDDQKISDLSAFSRSKMHAADMGSASSSRGNWLKRLFRGEARADLRIAPDEFIPPSPAQSPEQPKNSHSARLQPATEKSRLPQEPKAADGAASAMDLPELEPVAVVAPQPAAPEPDPVFAPLMPQPRPPRPFTFAQLTAMANTPAERQTAEPLPQTPLREAAREPISAAQEDRPRPAAPARTTSARDVPSRFDSGARSSAEREVVAPAWLNLPPLSDSRSLFPPVSASGQRFRSREAARAHLTPPQANGQPSPADRSRTAGALGPDLSSSRRINAATASRIRRNTSPLPNLAPVATPPLRSQTAPAARDASRSHAAAPKAPLPPLLEPLPRLHRDWALLKRFESFRPVDRGQGS